MTGSWIVYGLLVGGLIAIGAWALDEVCKIAGRPHRWVWAGALLLTLGLVGLAPYRTVMLAHPMGAASIKLPAPTAGPAAMVRTGSRTTLPSAPTRNASSPALRNIRSTITAGIYHAIALVGQHLPAPVVRYFLVLWCSVSALLLVLFTAVSVHFHRVRRGWPATELHGLRVRVTSDGGPAVVGVFRPMIVVPYWLLRHSGEQQRLVLAHEEEHMRAHDPLLLAGACVVATLLPWHPAVWWMLARLRLAVELDCDVRVLRRGVAPRAYGTLLIDLAGRCSSLPVGAPALADKSSHLQQRLLAMKPLPLHFARARGTALGGFAVMTFILACATQVPIAGAQVRSDAQVPPQTQTEAPRGPNELDDPVQQISLPEPHYPAALKSGGISGRVELQYVVDTSGHVEPNSFKVLNQTDEAFVTAAKEAILQGVFKPAKLRGRPVRQLVQQAVSFRAPEPNKAVAAATGQQQRRRSLGNAITTIQADSVAQQSAAQQPVRLNELVTTAGEPQQRRDIGNAVTTIQADSVMQHAVIRNLTDLLDHRVPGLTTQDTTKQDTTSGAPGDPARLRLRGLGSAFRSNDPVVIVDGVRVYAAQGNNPAARDSTTGRPDSAGVPAPSPLDQIDPNIIDKIEVFKGPSAAALYGPDAANGVIVITTKRKKAP